MRLNNSRRSDQKNNFMPASLALILTLMASANLIALFLIEVPAQNQPVVLVITGQLMTLWGLSVGYYYSTNSSSKAKDQLLAASVPVQRGENETN